MVDLYTLHVACTGCGWFFTKPSPMPLCPVCHGKSVRGETITSLMPPMPVGWWEALGEIHRVEKWNNPAWPVEEG